MWKRFILFTNVQWLILNWRFNSRCFCLGLILEHFVVSIVESLLLELHHLFLLVGNHSLNAWKGMVFIVNPILRLRSLPLNEARIVWLSECKVVWSRRLVWFMGWSERLVVVLPWMCKNALNHWWFELFYWRFRLCSQTLLGSKIIRMLRWFLYQ